MGNMEKVQDWTGRVTGKLETKSNGDKVLYDFYGKKLGEYKKSSNTTFAFGGRKVGNGDILLTLLR